MSLLGNLYQTVAVLPWRYHSRWLAINRMLRWSPKEMMLWDAFSMIGFNRVPGDYVEFGVGTGQTISAAYHLCRAVNLKMPHPIERHFWGFDSFQGLQTVSEIDAEEGQSFQSGKISYNVKQVEGFFRRRRVPGASTTLVEGWFDKTLTDETRQRIGLKKAALIWLDSDLYMSAVPALKFITPLLQPGTVLVCDDWWTFRGSPDHGEQLALREWCTQHPEWNLVSWRGYGWHGQAFVVRQASG